MNLLQKILNRKQKVREEMDQKPQSVSVIDAPLDISWKDEPTLYDNGEYTAKVESLPFDVDKKHNFFYLVNDCEGVTGSTMRVKVQKRTGDILYANFFVKYGGNTFTECAHADYTMEVTAEDKNHTTLVGKKGREFKKRIRAKKNRSGTNVFQNVRCLVAALAKKEGNPDDIYTDYEPKFHELVKFAAVALDDALAHEEIRMEEKIRQQIMAQQKASELSRERLSKS